ncbi:MAG: SDR family oxidoreductase [Gemmatimonadetes bacterium]|nr:SDR family oxidoreductase [Gemmatimonadota bacterium]
MPKEESGGNGTAETVLITGASSGIGTELARIFAREGSNVVLVARSEAKLVELAADLMAKHGVRAIPLRADLAELGAAQQIFERLRADGEQVDVLVNNAGFGFRGAFAEIDVAAQLDMIQVNVTAPTHLARLFLPPMLARGHGGILNVASAAGFQPGPWMNVYYATKAYLLHFSEALGEEVAGTGVRVSCLAPGPTHTGFGDLADMGPTRLFKLGAMSAQKVAEAGYRGLRRGDSLVVPGARNAAIPWMIRMVPRVAGRRIAGFLNR